MNAMFWGLVLAKKHGLSGSAALKAAMISRAVGTSPAGLLLANAIIARDAAPKPTGDSRRPPDSSRTNDAERIEGGSKAS
jgi:hypothetical protein